MREDRKIKFYNAGDRIQTTLRYSIPTGHDIHVIANYTLDAPEAAFFTVPEESEVDGATIRHSFDRDIMRDYGERGVILVDANHQAKEDFDQEEVFPIANSNEAAKEKGKRKWMKFVNARVKDFLDQCDTIKSVGGVPRAATGVTLRYLRIAGVLDPSDAALREYQKQGTLVEDLQKTIKKQQETLDMLLADRTKPDEAEEPEAVGAGKAKGKGK